MGAVKGAEGGFSTFRSVHDLGVVSLSEEIANRPDRLVETRVGGLRGRGRGGGGGGVLGLGLGHGEWGEINTRIAIRS